MWLCMTEPVQVNLSNMEFVGSICFLLLSAPSVCAVWFLSLSPSVPPFLHSPPRVAVFHSRKISTNSELPPTSTVTCTSFTLLSLFSRTFFFLDFSLLAPWTAVARQQLIEHEGYAIDQLEVFYMKSGVKSFHTYSYGFNRCSVDTGCWYTVCIFEFAWISYVRIQNNMDMYFCACVRACKYHCRSDYVCFWGFSMK